MDIGAGIVLVLGGARSGKSEVAERLVAAASLAAPVTYIATGAVADPSSDPDWAARVAAHRARRPPAWETVDVRAGGDLASALAAARAVVLVDSLGTWVAGLPAFGAGADVAAPLLRALDDRRATGHPSVLVSEEVGLGVHPSSPAGRQFRDELGTLNRRLADGADQVLLVVAGRALALSGPSAL